MIGLCDGYTGKERDQESGLDYFGARYYGSALGRFTSPDEPFADQSPEDPQSWNLYGYVRNNPLNSTDPDGREKHCDSNGNNCTFETTVTDTAEQIVFATTFTLINTAHQYSEAAQQAVNWLAQPRNPTCMAGSMSAWGGAGFASGAAAGLAGGPFAEVTVPGGAGLGFLGGSAAGWASGMVSSMSGNGGTGSSGQDATGSDKSPKEWQITNPADKKVVGGRTYLKDAKTGTWWSKDTAGHGGSAWKVYKETAPGKLDWIADADAQGNFISGKWKSPTGTSITF